MSFTKDDLREIKWAISDMAKKLECAAQLSVRPICIAGGEEGQCFNAYGVFKTETSGTTLIRIESADGVQLPIPDEVPLDTVITSCTCDCIDLLSSDFIPPQNGEF